MATSNTKLSDSQRARVERNRQRALLLRQAKISNHPYLNKNVEECTFRSSGSRIKDTGGGFFLEEDDLGAATSVPKAIHPPASILVSDRPHCEDCQKEFVDSYLFTNFSENICNNCRDSEDKHALITKTDAKSMYLLKDCDLDKREPLLKFIMKTNPSNPNWGSMKLYLKLQVEKRALEIYGTEEKLEEEQERRLENRDKLKQKRFDKKVKELRRAVRSSLFKKDSSTHEHDFGDEAYDEDEDMYSKSCKSCGHTISYEKM